MRFGSHKCASSPQDRAAGSKNGKVGEGAPSCTSPTVFPTTSQPFWPWLLLSFLPGASLLFLAASWLQCLNRHLARSRWLSWPPSEPAVPPRFLLFPPPTSFAWYAQVPSPKHAWEDVPAHGGSGRCHPKSSGWQWLPARIAELQVPYRSKRELLKYPCSEFKPGIRYARSIARSHHLSLNVSRDE